MGRQVYVHLKLLTFKAIHQHSNSLAVPLPCHSACLLILWRLHQGSSSVHWVTFKSLSIILLFHFYYFIGYTIYFINTFTVLHQSSSSIHCVTNHQYFVTIITFSTVLFLLHTLSIVLQYFILILNAYQCSINALTFYFIIFTLYVINT